MPILETDVGSLYYRVKGSGQTIVFVNGWGMTEGCWEPVVEILAPQFRCLTYDPRGVGRSLAGPEATYEMADHVDDLSLVCEAERVFDAHVVGHELGGRIGAITARMHPQIASTLTIVGWWGMAEINEALDGFARFRQATSLLLRDLGTFPVLRNLVAWGYRRVPEPHRTRLFEDFAQLDAQAAYTTALAAADPASNAAFDDALSHLRAPVLLVRGSEDREAARLGLRRLFKRLPHVDLATIHGAGSLPMLEHPDAFARTLRQFFGERERELMP